MWFDARAKLAEIVAPPCDIRDTGRQFSNYCDVSVITVSQMSQRPPRKSEPKPSAEAFRHGVSFAGKAKAGAFPYAGNFPPTES